MSRSAITAALLGGLIAGACALPPAMAGAVDRRLGAEVPKPALSGEAWSADATTRLGADLDGLLDAAPTLHGAHVGLLVLDTRNGAVLYARNADDAFMPGSTMKVLTGSAALAALASGYRFHTEAYVSAARSALYIKAGGDPLLTSRDVAAMVRAAVAIGGFRAPYATFIDAGRFSFDPYPRGWSWDDFVYDYAPKLTPAPIDENALQVTVSPGKHVGDPLIIRPSAPLNGADDGLLFERCAGADVAFAAPPAKTGSAGSADTLDVIRYPPAGCLAFTGSLPIDGGPDSVGVALREPTAALYRRVERFVARDHPPMSHALYTSDPVPADARLVWAHDGEPLSDLLADMWWPSDNFIAEMLLRAVGLQQAGAPGTTGHGADAERTWLRSIGIDPATLTIADGSGLSTYDRITPRALAAMLQADWNGPYRDIVLDDLPLAGARGTLRHAFIGTLAEGRTFAKDGSVNHTRGLAGYLVTLHHGALTFAWSVDDWMGKQADLDALRGRVLSRLIGD